MEEMAGSERERAPIPVNSKDVTMDLCKRYHSTEPTRSWGQRK